MGYMLHRRCLATLRAGRAFYKESAQGALSGEGQDLRHEGPFGDLLTQAGRRISSHAS